MSEPVLDEYEENIRYMISLQRTLVEDIEQRRILQSTFAEDYAQPSCSYEVTEKLTEQTSRETENEVVEVAQDSEETTVEVEVEVTSEEAPKNFKTAEDELENLRFICEQSELPEIVVENDSESNEDILAMTKKDDFDPLECLNYNVDFIRTNSTTSSRGASTNNETSYLSDMWNSLLDRVDDVQSRLRRHTWHEEPEDDEPVVEETKTEKKSRPRPKSEMVDVDDSVFDALEREDEAEGGSDETLFDLNEFGNFDELPDTITMRSRTEEDDSILDFLLKQEEKETRTTEVTQLEQADRCSSESAGGSLDKIDECAKTITDVDLTKNVYDSFAQSDIRVNYASQSALSEISLDSDKSIKESFVTEPAVFTDFESKSVADSSDVIGFAISTANEETSESFKVSEVKATTEVEVELTVKHDSGSAEMFAPEIKEESILAVESSADDSVDNSQVSISIDQLETETDFGGSIAISETEQNEDFVLSVDQIESEEIAEKDTVIAASLNVEEESSTNEHAVDIETHEQNIDTAVEFSEESLSSDENILVELSGSSEAVKNSNEIYLEITEEDSPVFVNVSKNSEESTEKSPQVIEIATGEEEILQISKLESETVALSEQSQITVETADETTETPLDFSESKHSSDENLTVNVDDSSIGAEVSEDIYLESMEEESPVSFQLSAATEESTVTTTEKTEVEVATGDEETVEISALQSSSEDTEETSSEAITVFLSPVADEIAQQEKDSVILSKDIEQNEVLQFSTNENECHAEEVLEKTVDLESKNAAHTLTEEIDNEVSVQEFSSKVEEEISEVASESHEKIVVFEQQKVDYSTTVLSTEEVAAVETTDIERSQKIAVSTAEAESTFVVENSEISVEVEDETTEIQLDFSERKRSSDENLTVSIDENSVGVVASDAIYLESMEEESPVSFQLSETREESTETTTEKTEVEVATADDEVVEIFALQSSSEDTEESLYEAIAVLKIASNDEAVQKEDESVVLGEYFHQQTETLQFTTSESESHTEEAVQDTVDLDAIDARQILTEEIASEVSVQEFLNKLDEEISDIASESHEKVVRFEQQNVESSTRAQSTEEAATEEATDIRRNELITVSTAESESADVAENSEITVDVEDEMNETQLDFSESKHSSDENLVVNLDDNSTGIEISEDVCLVSMEEESPVSFQLSETREESTETTTEKTEVEVATGDDEVVEITALQSSSEDTEESLYEAIAVLQSPSNDGAVQKEDESVVLGEYVQQTETPQLTTSENESHTEEAVQNTVDLDAIDARQVLTEEIVSEVSVQEFLSKVEEEISEIASESHEKVVRFEQQNVESSTTAQSTEEAATEEATDIRRNELITVSTAESESADVAENSEITVDVEDETNETQLDFSESKHNSDENLILNIDDSSTGNEISEDVYIESVEDESPMSVQLSEAVEESIDTTFEKTEVEVATGDEETVEIAALQSSSDDTEESSSEAITVFRSPVIDEVAQKENDSVILSNDVEQTEALQFSVSESESHTEEAVQKTFDLESLNAVPMLTEELKNEVSSHDVSSKVEEEVSETVSESHEKVMTFEQQNVDSLTTVQSTEEAATAESATIKRTEMITVSTAESESIDIKEGSDITVEVEDETNVVQLDFSESQSSSNEDVLVSVDNESIEKEPLQEIYLETLQEEAPKSLFLSESIEESAHSTSEKTEIEVETSSKDNLEVTHLDVNDTTVDSSESVIFETQTEEETSMDQVVMEESAPKETSTIMIDVDEEESKEREICSISVEELQVEDLELVHEQSEVFEETPGSLTQKTEAPVEQPESKEVESTLSCASSVQALKLSENEVFDNSVVIVSQLNNCCRLAKDLTEDDILFELLKFANDNEKTDAGKRLCKLVLSLTHDINTLSDVMGSDNFCFDTEEQDFLVSYLNSIATELSEILESEDIKTLFKQFGINEPKKLTKLEFDIHSLVSAVFAVLSSVEDTFGPSVNSHNSLEQLFELQEQMIDLSLSLSLIDKMNADDNSVVEMQVELEEVINKIVKFVHEDSENVLGLSFDLKAAVSELYVEPLKVLTNRLRIRGRSRKSKKQVHFNSFDEVFPETESEEDSFLRKLANVLTQA